jgi:hypothetical protein
MCQTDIRKSLLPAEFVSLLAQQSHSTVNEVYEMFSSCELCHQDAVFPVVALEGVSWFGNSDSGKKLRLAVYGLCEACAALPDTIQNTNRKLFEESHTPK